MSDAEENPPLASDTMDETLSEPDKPLNGSDSAARHSLEPSYRASQYEGDITQQLAELKALNEKHSQIISLLQNRFDIPMDISENASRLLSSVRDGWKRLIESRRLAGVAYEVTYEAANKTSLLQILPCGPHFMGLDVKETSSFGEDPVQTSTLKSEERIQKAETAFKHSLMCFHVERPFPRSSSYQSSWRPVILANGKPTTDLEKCAWPSNWDFLSTYKFRNGSEHSWSFLAAVPPGGWDNPGGAFDLRSILLPFNDEGSIPRILWPNLPLLYGTMCFEDIATIISMSSDYGSAGDLSFFIRHFGPWMGHRGSAWQSLSEGLAEGVVDLGVTDFVVLRGFDYYMKSFRFTAVDVTDNAAKTAARKTRASSDGEVPVSGFQFEREALSVENTSGRRISLLEHRYSTRLTMTPLRAPIGNFRLFSITDTFEGGSYYDPHPISRFDWDGNGIHPAGLLTGVAAFQAQMYHVITSWAADWDGTLNKLSAVFSVTPMSIENEKELDRLMYDPDLKKTRTYFKVLQILRIFSDAIETAEVDIEWFSDYCSSREYEGEEGLPQEERLVIDHNWARLKSFHHEKAKKLLFQISGMKKEIESLRDGLFNAQSVREAQKSRELNKIMMVFTIVTILFLPPTFVATFFGVEVFHAASDVQTRKIFWTVFSIVTVTTFVTSIGAILGLLTPASWTRLRGAIPKVSGSSDNLPAEQDEPERTQSTWGRLSSFLGRHRVGARTSKRDSTLA